MYVTALCFHIAGIVLFKFVTAQDFDLEMSQAAPQVDSPLVLMN